MAVVAGPRVSNRAFAKPRPDPRRSRCGDLLRGAAALRDQAWIPGLCASGTGQNSELLAAVFTRRLDDDLKGFQVQLWRLVLVHRDTRSAGGAALRSAICRDGLGNTVRPADLKLWTFPFLPPPSDEK